MLGRRQCAEKDETGPKLFLYLMMFMKYYAGTDALQHPYHFGNGVPRWKGQKDMDIT
jgi:hypothetical protein